MWADYEGQSHFFLAPSIFGHDDGFTVMRPRFNFRSKTRRFGRFAVRFHAVLLVMRFGSCGSVHAAVRFMRFSSHSGLVHAVLFLHWFRSVWALRFMRFGSGRFAVHAVRFSSVHITLRFVRFDTQGLVDQHQVLVDQHPRFGGSTPGFCGSAPRVWWIDNRFWWINTRFWWINTQGLVVQLKTFFAFEPLSVHPEALGIDALGTWVDAPGATVRNA